MMTDDADVELAPHDRISENFLECAEPLLRDDSVALLAERVVGRGIQRDVDEARGATVAILTFKPPPLLESSPILFFSGLYMGYGVFAFGLFAVFRAFFDCVCAWGGSNHFRFVLPTTPFLKESVGELVRLTTCKRLTNSLPKLSLRTGARQPRRGWCWRRACRGWRSLRAWSPERVFPHASRF